MYSKISLCTIISRNKNHSMFFINHFQSFTLNNLKVLEYWFHSCPKDLRNHWGIELADMLQVTLSCHAQILTLSVLWWHDWSLCQIQTFLKPTNKLPYFQVMSPFEIDAFKCSCLKYTCFVLKLCY